MQSYLAFLQAALVLQVNTSGSTPEGYSTVAALFPVQATNSTSDTEQNRRLSLAP